jgi:hypothetical protein
MLSVTITHFTSVSFAPIAYTMLYVFSLYTGPRLYKQYTPLLTIIDAACDNTMSDSLPSALWYTSHYDTDRVCYVCNCMHIYH